MEPIILASSSVRRQDILRQIGLPFTVMPSSITEELDSSLSPAEQTIAFARMKVERVLSTIKDRSLPWILGADTLIYFDGNAVGKPASREDADAILRKLSGRTHQVVTGVALYNGKTKHIDLVSDTSEVEFSTLCQEEIDWYLETGEWQGVAGGYRIQGKAAVFINSIKGSYSSVMGLPIHQLYAMLMRASFVFE